MKSKVEYYENGNIKSRTQESKHYDENKNIYTITQHEEFYPNGKIKVKTRLKDGRVIYRQNYTQDGKYDKADLAINITTTVAKTTFKVGKFIFKRMIEYAENKKR